MIKEHSFTNSERAKLNEAAPDLLEALQCLQKELKQAVKFNVKTHYSLMLADVAASLAPAKKPLPKQQGNNMRLFLYHSGVYLLFSHHKTARKWRWIMWILRRRSIRFQSRFYTGFRLW